MSFSVALVGGPMDGRIVVLNYKVARLTVPVLRDVWERDPDWPEHPIRFDQVNYAPRNKLMAAIGIWEPEK